MFFSNTSSYPIGLDISDYSLKLVQLKKIGDKIKIQALGRTRLKEGLFENGEIINKEEIIKKIQELISKPNYGKVTSKEIVACLPETKTFIKLIEIKKTSGDLNENIKTEIEKHVPMAIDDIYYDWQIIDDFSDVQNILIGAAPKNIVNQYTDLLDSTKLSIAALEIEPISLCRSLLAEEHSKFNEEFKNNYAIIDIGANRSNITVYSKNTILFSFSIPISGNQITKKISETLKINREQAEKAKIICGLDKNKAQGIIKNMMYGMIKELIAKVNNSIMFYNHHFPDNGPINKIFLCGGGANIKNLNNLIKDYISIETIPGNAFVNINEDKENINKIFSEKFKLNMNLSDKNKTNTSSITQNSGLSYATAIGLALRKIFINKI